MNGPADLRPGETAVDLPPTTDAGLYFIGRVETPWRERSACPRRGDPTDGPLCRLIVDPPWSAALLGLTPDVALEVLYWMHLARRDLLQQNPGQRGTLFGTFALRSPVRPNPIATSIVRIIAVEPGEIAVRGMDCLDGTPLLDLKPSRCPLWTKS